MSRFAMGGVEMRVTLPILIGLEFWLVGPHADDWGWNNVS